MLLDRAGVLGRAAGDHARILPEEGVVVAKVAVGRLLSAVTKREVAERHCPWRSLTARGLPRGPRLHRALGKLVRRAAAHDPAVAIPRRALEGHVGGATQYQRRPPARGPRSDGAGRAERLARPDRLPLLEHLLEAPAADVEVDAGGVVVVLAAADGDAEHEPPVREAVDARGLLGDERTVGAVGRDEDGGGKPDSLGHSGGRRQGDERLVVVVHDAVDGPEAREAARLRPARPL